MSQFTHFKDYIQLDKPIDFGKFEAIGWFPYEKAQITFKNNNESACPPRTLFNHIENILNEIGIRDNKYVVIFKDKQRFGTDYFVIQFKDCCCKVGSLDCITGYALRKLQ